MPKVTLSSRQVCQIRSALYAAANHKYEQKAETTAALKGRYEAEGDELYTLAEQLKEVTQLESK